jgi:hypothetical protein
MAWRHATAYRARTKGGIMTKKAITSLVAATLVTAVSVCWAGDTLKSGLGGGLGAAAGAAVGDKLGGNNGAVVGGAAGGAIGAAATTQGSGRKGAVVGGAVGGAAGAAIGQQTGGKNGAIVGAGLGGAAGAAVGREMTAGRDSKPVTQAVQAQPQPQAAAVVSVGHERCGHHPKGKAKGWSKNHKEC